LVSRSLQLKRPIYEKTAENGHFGHDEFPWEQPQKLVIPKSIAERLENGTGGSTKRSSVGSNLGH